MPNSPQGPSSSSGASLRGSTQSSVSSLRVQKVKTFKKSVERLLEDVSMDIRSWMKEGAGEGQASGTFQNRTNDVLRALNTWLTGYTGVLKDTVLEPDSRARKERLETAKKRLWEMVYPRRSAPEPADGLTCDKWWLFSETVRMTFTTKLFESGEYISDGQSVEVYEQLVEALCRGSLERVENDLNLFAVGQQFAVGKQGTEAAEGWTDEYPGIPSFRARASVVAWLNNTN